MIFVTGGTGLLGNCIVRELCQRQLPTRVLCRRGTSRIPFDGLPVEIVEGDLSSTHVLDSAIAGCQGVIHSAALIHIGWRKLAESREVNVTGTQHVIDACRKHAARLIHVSTVDTLPAASSRAQPIDERGMGGIPKTPCSYVVSKTEAEQLVRNSVRDSALDAVIVHPGFMLGPYDWKPSSGRMFLEVAKSPVVAAPSGGCSLCDARRVAAACVNAIEQGVRGESYILAGDNLTYRELWQQMLAVAGRRKHVFRMGPAANTIGKTLDLAHRWLRFEEGDVNSAALAMGSLQHYYDSSKASRELAYQAGFPADGLGEVWHWLQNRCLPSAGQVS